MLSLPLVALCLAAIGACAEPAVHAVDYLEVSLSAPVNKVASPSDLNVIATVKNAGEGVLKILKFGTVLDDEHPTRSFIISKDGKDVPFAGTTAMAPMYHLSESDWVVIPAGENVTVEHKVWTLYDFSASGPGTFTFDPVSRFQVIGFNESVETTSDATRKNVVNGRSFPISITITGVSKREVELKKGDFDVRCSDSGRTSKIVSSILDAAYLASAAVLYIRAHPDDPLYRKYFGGNSPLTVADNYDRILVAVKTDLPMYCSDPSGTCDVIEYDALQKGKEIFYCDRFFGEGPLCGGKGDVQDGTMRGGTTLRMFGYIFAGMGSSGETCSSSQNLPDDKKIKDGVNYECFATQVYRNTKC